MRQHPLENALVETNGKQWRVSAPGSQTIRVAFDKPQSLRQIHMVFREERYAGTQEFALYATSADHQRTEVVRRQWSFRPDASTLDTEEFVVNLPEVLILELQIDPGRHDKAAVASLEFLGLS